jgi:hypothetical protein
MKKPLTGVNPHAPGLRNLQIPNQRKIK